MKEPYWPQSDDQFTVHDYCIRNGIDYQLVRHHPPDASILLTVHEFDLLNAPPFDVKLHEVAERLRHE